MYSTYIDAREIETRVVEYKLIRVYYCLFAAEDISDYTLVSQCQHVRPFIVDCERFAGKTKITSRPKTLKE